MDDKNLMENILQLQKGVCDLYMHGTIESSTGNVHNAFNCALNESLCLQENVYSQMAQKGWYPAEQVEQQKINTVKQKYQNA